MSTQLETIDAEIVDEKIDGSLALTALTRAEIDMQQATARAFPRSIKEFKQQALELATLDEDTAASMFYRLPRGKNDDGSVKYVEGPSVRLAEVIRYSWGHIRSEAFISEIDDKFVTATGTCYDVQKNVAARVSVKRRITDSRGRRFKDDMIAVTSNAACSIAAREATFRVIPRALFKDIYSAARKTAVGTEATLKSRRTRCIEFFAKKGISEARVLAKLGRKGVDDITLDDLSFLTGLRTSIQDEEITAEAAFAVDDDKAPSPDTAELNAKIEARKKEMAEQAEKAKAPSDSSSLPDSDSDMAE